MTDSDMMDDGPDAPGGGSLEAEDYLLDCMGDAILLWDSLRHPQRVPRFHRFEQVVLADPWAARESVAQLVEFYHHATGHLDAASDSLAELFLLHFTNAAETEGTAEDDDPFIECLIDYDDLPKAGDLLAALLAAEHDARPAIETRLHALRVRRQG